MKNTVEIDRIYADWEQRVIEEVTEEDWKQGLRQSFMALYELRFETIAAELRDALDRVQDGATLGRLVLVCGLCPQENVIDILRQTTQRDSNRGARYRVRRGPEIR